MTSIPTGRTTEGVMDRQGLQTWYLLVEDALPAADRLPLVVCHGGPGLTHDYLLRVARLSGAGRPCVFYDQFGNGRSGRRPGAPAEFWTVELFVRELESLIDHLGLADGFHLLGHSWGGMLALELAVRRPSGLRSVVVADAFASSALYLEEVAGLVAGLPAEARTAIERHEAAGTTDSAEYQKAIRVFYGRHVCRARPVPDEVMSTLAALAKDSTVYETMAGPSEFTMTGVLRDWDITDRLHQVEVPVLLVTGRHDEVTPRAAEPLWRRLPNVKWEIFEDSSHMPHVEEHDRFVALVDEFLRAAD
ncbi:MAG TPA: proline iminopeptidase-family hydrolase [Streptosporangiaceae bacterium]|nr:proline iminopeptidase-family hydrolase [Streptosporangiaceae bacterium]